MQEIRTAVITVIASGTMELDMELPVFMDGSSLAQKIMEYLRTGYPEVFGAWNGLDLYFAEKHVENTDTLAAVGALSGSRLIIQRR